MTAPDPRVGEIEARLSAANAELDRLTSGNPGANWRWSIPANPERDSDIILSASIADVAYLLAELRKAHEALARVESLADEWEAGYGPGTRKAEVFGPQKVSIEFAVKSIRAAVAAANGDGQVDNHGS